MSNPFENIEKNYCNIPLEDIEIAMQDHGGFCLICGNEAYGVEPDARNYQCEADYCGEMAVFGAEEIILMGNVK